MIEATLNKEYVSPFAQPFSSVLPESRETTRKIEKIRHGFECHFNGNTKNDKESLKKAITAINDIYKIVIPTAHTDYYTDSSLEACRLARQFSIAIGHDLKSFMQGDYAELFEQLNLYIKQDIAPPAKFYENVQRAFNRDHFVSKLQKINPRADKTTHYKDDKQRTIDENPMLSALMKDQPVRLGHGMTQYSHQHSRLHVLQDECIVQIGRIMQSVSEAAQQHLTELNEGITK